MTQRDIAIEIQDFAHRYAGHQVEVICNKNADHSLKRFKAIIVGFVEHPAYIFVKAKFSYRDFIAYKDIGIGIRFTLIDNKIINEKESGRFYTIADITQIKIAENKKEIQDLIDKLEL